MLADIFSWQNVWNYFRHFLQVCLNSWATARATSKRGHHTDNKTDNEFNEVASVVKGFVHYVSVPPPLYSILIFHFPTKKVTNKDAQFMLIMWGLGLNESDTGL